MSAIVALCLPLLSVIGQTAGPDSVDVLRIREAFRLTAAAQDSVWPDGWGAVPFPLLLVTEEREFLVAFPRTPSGFDEGHYLATLGTRISERPRQWQPDLLATFPAFGPPSVIVVGRPEATHKNSATWVLTIVHERFHQFQTADSAYYTAVERLDLSGGDRTGMWMLNYPFPYRSKAVVERFSGLSRKLARLLDHSSASDRRAFWQAYTKFLADLSERDRRYLSFQVWQEGIARYVELRTAEFAARRYDPTPEFKALPDVQAFADIAPQMRAAILDALANPDLPGRERVSFYAFGAGLALLLDMDVPDWKRRYQTEKFAVERYLHPAG
jgi:hypothetical protein